MRPSAVALGLAAVLSGLSSLRAAEIGVAVGAGDLPVGEAWGMVRVVAGGEQRPVLGVTTIGERFRSVPVVIWAEAWSGASAAADAARHSAAALTTTGPVTIVVAEDLPQVWVESSVDPAEVAEVLAELAETELRSGPADPGASSRRLLAWLADRSTEPAARLLVTLGSPGTGGASGAALGVAIASLGWTHLLVSAEGAGEQAQHLVAASGGAVVDSEELTTTLRGYPSRLWVRWEPASLVAADTPQALEVSIDGTTDLLVASWSPGVLPAEVGQGRSERLIRELDAGQLDVEVGLQLVDGGGSARSEILWRDARLPPSSDSIRTTLVLHALDSPVTVFRSRGGGNRLEDASAWVQEVFVGLPRDFQEMVVVVEDLRDLRWGAAVADDSVESMGLLGADVVAERLDLRVREAPSGEIVAAVEAEKLIRLLPLETREASGERTFRTIATSDVVRSATFLLDGEEIFTDERAPFQARIDLGSGSRPARVEVVGYDRYRREVARDSLVVNPLRVEFGVSASMSRLSDGRLAVETDVVAPEDDPVERVEMWWNETLVETLRSAPWAAQLAARAGAGGDVDFLRVVAFLRSGRSVEDVEVFSRTGLVEQVEVNLVEIYAVVHDRDGNPITDLEGSELELELAGRPIEVERFGRAEDVSLGLGLVIDTSGSMEALIQDTRTAALRFLTDFVRPKDSAFIVDFDSEPRLAAPMTQDLRVLFRALAGLVARGNTALYDAVVFSLLHFEPGQERRALVLLTDGDDYRSRFGVKRAIEQARGAGVPVYVVSLASLETFSALGRRRPVSGASEVELRDLTRKTGGRLFYLSELAELSATYAQIGAELRNQYVIAFASERALSDEDLDRLEIKVLRPRTDVRAVVAGRSVQTR